MAKLLSAKTAETKPAGAMLTNDEAQQLGKALNADLQYDADALARFVLLLQYLANHADQSDRENVYIWTEADAMSFIRGTSEAVEAQLKKQPDALRRNEG